MKLQAKTSSLDHDPGGVVVPYTITIITVAAIITLGIAFYSLVTQG